jgi:hypothetical protein
MVAMERCLVCEGMRQEAFVTLTCNHTYHPSCILFIASATNKCPQCNHSISAEQKAALEAAKATFCQSRPKVYHPYQKCFICDDRIPELQTEDLVILNCDHAYHPTCILTWSFTNPSCPQCKYPISPEQQEYFTYIIDDDYSSSSSISEPISSPDIPQQEPSFMIRYKNRLILSCCGISALICYYHKDDIVAWFKKASKQQEIL